MPTTSLRIITIVVVAIAILAAMCVGTLAYCMVTATQVPEGLNAAFTGVTGGLVGALTGLLANTRTNHSSDDAVPVTVQNSKNKPVPTAETKK